ncbi:hypothetical protein VTO73DRAFT_14255 [Trametes versicolor]
MNVRRREVASGTSPGRDLPAIISWRSPCGHGALCSNIPPLQVAGVRPQDLRRPPMAAGVELPVVPRHRGDCMRAFIGCKHLHRSSCFIRPSVPSLRVPLLSICCEILVPDSSTTARSAPIPPPPSFVSPTPLSHPLYRRWTHVHRLPPSAARLYNSTRCRLHVDPANPHSSSLCIFAPHTRRSCSPHHSYVYLMHPCHAVMGGPHPVCVLSPRLDLYPKTHRHPVAAAYRAPSAALRFFPFSSLITNLRIVAPRGDRAPSAALSISYTPLMIVPSYQYNISHRHPAPSPHILPHPNTQPHFALCPLPAPITCTPPDPVCAPLLLAPYPSPSRLHIYRIGSPFSSCTIYIVPVSPRRTSASLWI